MCEYPTGVLFNLIKTHILTSEQARRTDSLNVTVRHRLQQGKANQATPCVVPLLEKVPIAPAKKKGEGMGKAGINRRGGKKIGWREGSGGAWNVRGTHSAHGIAESAACAPQDVALDSPLLSHRVLKAAQVPLAPAGLVCVVGGRGVWGTCGVWSGERLRVPRGEAACSRSRRSHQTKAPHVAFPRGAGRPW